MSPALQPLGAGDGASAVTLDTLSGPLLEEELRLTSGRGGQRAHLLRLLLALADSLAAGCAALLGALVSGLSPLGTLAFVVVVVLAWVGSAFVGGLYTVDGLSAWATGAPEVARQAGLALLLSWPMFGAAALLGADRPIAAALVGAPLALVLATTGHSATRTVLHRHAPLNQRTVIVGSGIVAGQIHGRLMRHPEFGLESIGLVDDDPHHAVDIDLPVLGTLGELPDILDAYAVDRVIIAFSRAGHEELLGCLRACRENRVAVDVVPRLFEFLGGARTLEQIGDVPLLSIGMPRLSRTSLAAKRVVDIAFSLLVLFAMLPLFVAIAIAIKVESRGPVFFRQRRMGRGEEPFELIKFRSMYVDADARKAEYVGLNDHDDGVMFKIKGDPRVSRVGGFLRRLSLDEFPQFINVLRGEMSVVGPRPLILPEHEALAEEWHARRLDIRPGLTGPWQISGRSDLTGHDMVRLDFQYVTGWSLARDFEIILATVPAVFSGRGAY